ncbi:MAG TPA: cation diffusion facilitator family transporter [Acidimicrobiales bacterium]|nr:cation diffusion facilitator family transporter [Acidimicrobiales bacterium]
MSRSQRIVVALVLDTALVGGELVGALAARSTALLADVGHNLADAAALVLALVAVRLTLRSPTASRSFGYHRATILTALANVAVIIVVTALIAIEAVQRILHPVAVHGGLVAIVAGIALAVNALAALALVERSRDLNIRVALLHLAGDAVASAAVLVAGLVIYATGRLAVLDPAVSLGVACLVALQGVRLARESVDVLLESSPADVDLEALARAITDVDGVAEVHDLHCWSLSSEVRALSAHVVLTGHPSLEEAQLVGERVKVGIGRPFSIAHATFELECERCVEADAEPCAIEVAPGT